MGIEGVVVGEGRVKEGRGGEWVKKERGVVREFVGLKEDPLELNTDRYFDGFLEWSTHKLIIIFKSSNYIIM